MTIHSTFVAFLYEICRIIKTYMVLPVDPTTQAKEKIRKLLIYKYFKKDIINYT